MDSRKVIKIKDSFYFNIPLEISKALEIMKGDRLNISYIPGCGLLITLDQGADKIPVNLESVDRLQRAADAIRCQLERKAKDLGDNFISDLWGRLIPAIATSGIFDLKARVEKLETKSEVSDQRRGKLVLLHKKKRSTQ
jgi:hypothetical protein